MPRPEHEPNPQWQIHAAIYAWLLPGLGHVAIGQRKRGVIVGLTILAVWLTGVFLGGVTAIERRQLEDENTGRTKFSPWFLGQALIAPSFAVDLQLRHWQKMHGGWHPHLYADKNPAYEPSFGKVNEQGVLYASLAGLLNLLAILDVMYCDPAFRRRLDAGLVALNEYGEPIPPGATPEADDAGAAGFQLPQDDTPEPDRALPQRGLAGEGGVA